MDAELYSGSGTFEMAVKHARKNVKKTIGLQSL